VHFLAIYIEIMHQPYMAIPVLLSLTQMTQFQQWIKILTVDLQSCLTFILLHTIFHLSLTHPASRMWAFECQNKSTICISRHTTTTVIRDMQFFFIFPSLFSSPKLQFIYFYSLSPLRSPPTRQIIGYWSCLVVIKWSDQGMRVNFVKFNIKT
jgi:hypothetical protein